MRVLLDGNTVERMFEQMRGRGGRQDEVRLLRGRRRRQRHIRKNRGRKVRREAQVSLYFSLLAILHSLGALFSTIAMLPFNMPPQVVFSGCDVGTYSTLKLFIVKFPMGSNKMSLQRIFSVC